MVLEWWIGLYIVGVALATIGALTNTNLVFYQGKSWPTVLGIIFWPITLLPIMFLVFCTGTLFYMLYFCLWIFEKFNGEFCVGKNKISLENLRINK